MSTPSVLDRFLDPMTECLTPEVAQRLLDTVFLDQQTQGRLDELADKSNRGALSDDERSEYEEYVEAMDVVGIIKAKAQIVLQRQTS